MKQYEIQLTTFHKRMKKIWITAKSKEVAIAFAHGMTKDIESFDAEQEYFEKEYDSVKVLKEYDIDNKKR